MNLQNENWIQADTACDAPYFRKTFDISEPSDATIAICGLGFYELYINGQKINQECFIPITSDYHPRDTSEFLYPLSGNFTHRTYYDVYDVTKYLRHERNVIAVSLGNGWYNQTGRFVEGHQSFGQPRLTFLFKMRGNENLTIISDQKTRWHASEVTYNNLFYGEKQDSRLSLPTWQSANYDDSRWSYATTAPPLETALCLSKCPGDKIIDQIIPQKIQVNEARTIYDVGRCLSGRIVLNGSIANGETVTIRHADQLTLDGNLDFSSCGTETQIQTTEYTGNDFPGIFYPKFSWQAFRYFEVIGNFDGIGDTPLLCEVIHSDVKQTSSFHCSNETLNWIYNAYIATQLSNLHCGVPSDTPHRERLGYTGDGQLLCRAAMLTLGMQSFYRKWIQDILDCQDRDTGRVQHTAPFQGGGGGPASWGAAIVEIPYQYYIHYQDNAMLKTCFEPMLHWFSYLESKSENDLVVNGESGGWCLGDWNAPYGTTIPAPFVNTYFYIKSLLTVAKIAKIIGFDQKSEQLQNAATRKKAALRRHYYDEVANSYCGGIQAADAFAIDIGLGNPEILTNLNEKYATVNEFDTGIFGTDILIRVLFKHGFAKTAYQLLTADGTATYENMRRGGGTTLWESFLGGTDSRNHPMYGAVTSYLFTNILGIKYCGNKDLLIQPDLTDCLDFAAGKITTIYGPIKVEYVKKEGRIKFCIRRPQSMKVTLRFAGKDYPITSEKEEIAL